MKKEDNTHSLSPSIDFGKIFETYLTLHRTRKAVLARLIGKSFTMVSRYRTSPSMQSSTIETLSRALQHNFFLDMAAQLPAHYTVAGAPDTSKEDEIAALKQEILILKAEKELLIEIARK